MGNLSLANRIRNDELSDQELIACLEINNIHDPEEVAELESRNIKKYGNPIGSDVDALFKSNKIKLQKTNPYITDQEVWDAVIEGAMRKDEVINTL